MNGEQLRAALDRAAGADRPEDLAECPFCGAVAGDACRNAAGGRTATHVARERAAAAEIEWALRNGWRPAGPRPPIPAQVRAVLASECPTAASEDSDLMSKRTEVN